jgi:CRISPR-associated protein Csx10
MERVDFEVRTLSPLFMGQLDPTGLYGESQPYLPGAALRGAVAEVLLAQCSQPDHLRYHEGCPEREGCSFYELFGADGGPLFRNAYPIASLGGGPAYPLPLTALTCRTAPGFLDPNEPEEHHGVFDQLVALAACEEALGLWDERPTGEWLDPPERRCPFPDCGDKTEPRSWFYEGTLEEGFVRARAKTRRRSRTAVGRSRGVAAEALLYTQETINPNTYLRGSVLVEDGQRRLLQETLQQVASLGRGRSRGLGRVLVQTKRPYELTPLPERVGAFNSRLNETRQRYRSDLPSVDQEWFFTLDLLSDVQFTRCGLPAFRPDPEEWDLPDGAEVELMRAFARYDTAGGWASGGRLPRRTAPVTLMGSVYLYRGRGVPWEALVPTWEQLEVKGVGMERERGYGQVMICSPFHLKERLKGKEVP